MRSPSNGDRDILLSRPLGQTTVRPHAQDAPARPYVRANTFVEDVRQVPFYRTDAGLIVDLP